jgi:hypothetical protein
MSDTKWAELEYQSLRQEILSLTESQQSAARFFIPAAAVVYAVPYLLNRTSEPLLWSVCAGGSALMILAMSYTLLSYVDGIHKLGTYVAKTIEPKTSGGLRWETFLFQSQTTRTWTWPSEHVVISVVAIVAHVAAAFGAGRLFLAPKNALKPALVAAFFAILTIPAAYRMWRSGKARLGYAGLIEATLGKTVEASEGQSEDSGLTTQTTP